MGEVAAHQVMPIHHNGCEIYPLRQGSQFGLLIYRNGGYRQSKKNYPSPAEAISAGKKEIDEQRIYP